MVATKVQIEKIKAEGAAYRLATEYFLDVAAPTPVEDIAMDKNVLCVDAPLNVFSGEGRNPPTLVGDFNRVEKWKTTKAAAIRDTT